MSIRSGGHDYICASLKNDSLHLDLREINVIDLLQKSDVPRQVSVSANRTLLLLRSSNCISPTAVHSETWSSTGLARNWKHVDGRFKSILTKEVRFL